MEEGAIVPATGITENPVTTITDNDVSPNTLAALDSAFGNLSISGSPITEASVDRSYAFSPEVTAHNSSEYTFSISNKPAWLRLDSSTGLLSGTPAEEDQGVYTGIVLSVSDQESTATLDAFSIHVLSDAVTQALETGDASLALSDAILDEAIHTASLDVEACVSTLNAVYPTGLVTANMPYLSNYVYSNHRRNYPLHTDAVTGASYSWVGEKIDGTRYVYYGASIFQQTDSTYWGNLGAELKDNTLNVMSWITHSDSIEHLIARPLRLFAVTLRAQHQLEDWLQTHALSANWSISTNPEVLASGEYDLLIGMSGNDLPEVVTSLSLQKPVMLWSEVFNPGAGIQALGLGWNWWGGALVGAANSIEDQCDIAFPGTDILNTFTSLKNKQLQFSYTGDACPVNVYTTQCNSADVLRGDGVSLQEAFLAGAQELRQQLKQIDLDAKNVFSLDSNYRLVKLAVLLGDKYRQSISYPIDKETSTPDEFYSTYFADHVVHYARANNLAQRDVGDFSTNQLAIADKQGDSTLVAISPTPYNEWTSTGVTGRAGKPVTLTRLDDNPATLSVRFNMIRSGSTWIWNNHGYTRPKFVTSHAVSLPAGASVTLSTPVSSPVYAKWESHAFDGGDFTLRIDGAVKHPLLDTFDTESIGEFSADLKLGEFDWVDIKTPFAEVHSLNNSMINAFNAQDGDLYNGYTATDVQQWAHDLNTYLIGTNLGLAGYLGDGLPATKPNVAQFCSDRNLQCDDQNLHRKPSSQHINADFHASCGDLCSGNPFDLNSFVKPLAYGESHEMGHNLQRHRLNFYGSRSSETSNNIFPLHTAYRWMQDQGLAINQRIRLPDPQVAYTQLQETIRNKAEATIGHPIWADAQIYVNADVRLTLYVQLAYLHDQWEYDSSTGANGWDIYTKLYKLERLFTHAVDDDARWDRFKASLGFSNYDRLTAKSITGNDFMAVALSSISSYDHREYLTAWGIEISDEASAQIEANGVIDAVPLVFWRSPGDRYIRDELPSRNPDNALPMDGIAGW